MQTYIVDDKTDVDLSLGAERLVYFSTAEIKIHCLKVSPEAAPKCCSSIEIINWPS